MKKYVRKTNKPSKFVAQLPYFGIVEIVIDDYDYYIGSCYTLWEKKMSGIKKIHKEITIDRPTFEVKEIVLSRLQLLKGDIMKLDSNYIECGFGSLLKSRLLGEFFVSKTTLPKKLIFTSKISKIFEQLLLWKF
jgi:hypothetical protein